MQCPIPECPSTNFKILKEQKVKKYRTEKEMLLVKEWKCEECGHKWRGSEKAD